MSRTPTVRSPRSALLVLAAALGLLVSVFSLGLTASAGQPVTATSIQVTSVTTPGIDVPDTPGAPPSFIVKDTPFDVAVTFVNGTTPAPLSWNKNVRLDLSVPATETEPATVVATVTVPKTATSATFEGVVLTEAVPGLVLSIDSEPMKPGAVVVSGQTPAFDVLQSFVPADQDTKLSSIGSGGGANASCEATPEEPVCADLLLPHGSDSNILLSLGVCDNTTCAQDRLVVQALVELDGADYTRTAPATLVVKCDKSLCPGGGVPSYQLNVDDDWTGDLTTALACTDKGIIDEGLTYCVDYVQSTRSNAGDTELYLLFLADRRAAFP